MSGGDVVIVGGGVIGLSIAYALSAEGILATVVDAGPIGRGASWAGAGMIPAYASRNGHGPMIALRSGGAVLYREWSAALLDETGIDNGYRRSGGVDVAATEADEVALRTAAGRWRVEGIAHEKVSPSDFARVEPALSGALRMAYFLPDRAQVRNPRHLRALEAALRLRGATIRPETPVVGFDRLGDRIVAVRTESGPISCGTVVMTAGAWSGDLLAGLGVRLATAPLKGQIVLLRSARPLLARIVEHGKEYLVPRDDGRVLIGATEEDAGFDTTTTDEARDRLVATAVRLCPILAEAEVERSWAGLRPGSVDTRPTIGRVAGFANLVVATGHKRSGIQLAPSTAEVVADLVLGRPPRIDLASFAPGRPSGPIDDPAFRS